MKKEFLTEEHILFQSSIREFLKSEVTPYHSQWEKEGIVPREIWKKAGEQGFLAISVPEKYGGLGITDFRYNSILIEESAASGASGLGFVLHNDVALPYFERYCTEEQKERWLPKMVSGEIITALAMTEAGGGSDLANIKTTAKLEGDHFIVNGSKTFITNGILSDLVIVAVKTDSKAGAKGISLLVLERGMEGFDRGRNLEKIGLKAQDTAELFFNNVKVPKENLLGEEGKGFKYMMENLPQERLVLAIAAMGVIEETLRYTIEYCKERKAFGQSIGSFQNSRFKFAEMQTEAEIGRVFVDEMIRLLNDKKLSPEKAAMAKYWTTDLQLKVVDQCLQLHGGYGYMLEYRVARDYIDSRVQTIYGGTNEIMKEIIGRSMGF